SRLHPVEYDMIEMGIGAYDGSEILGQFSYLCDVRSAQPILHGTPDRRSNLEQFDEGVRPGESPSQIGFELCLEAIARGNPALGDHDHLAKPGVRGLQIE